MNDVRGTGSGGGVRRRMVLVTGCTGFVATHVVLQLVRSSEEIVVKGTVRRKGDSAGLVALMSGDEKKRFIETICDLTKEKGWTEACLGCDTVFHVASPVSTKNTEDELESVLKPALIGTTNVMLAAARSRSVKRVVVTSSGAAVYATWTSESEQTQFGELDFTDLWSPSCFIYARSKTASELCAWLFAKKTPLPRAEIVRRLTPPERAKQSSDDPKLAKGDAWLTTQVKEINALFEPNASRRALMPLEVVTVNPPYVLGEVLLPKHSGHIGSSADILREMMVHPDVYGQPPVDLGIVGIKDYARLHVLAGSEKRLSGRRIYAGYGFVPIRELARLVKKNFGPQGYGALLVFTWPRSLATLWWITHPYRQRVASRTMARVGQTAMEKTERGMTCDNALATELLGELEDLEATVVAAGNSFLSLGLLKPVRRPGTTIAAVACVSVAIGAVAAFYYYKST